MFFSYLLDKLLSRINEIQDNTNARKDINKTKLIKNEKFKAIRKND